MMEKADGIIEPLFEKIEEYSKTSIELWKFKAIEKISGIYSVVIAKLIWLFALLFCLLFLSFATAFYFGYILNNLFYGFLIVAMFYAITGVILAITQNLISKRIKNDVVKRLIDQSV